MCVGGGGSGEVREGPQIIGSGGGGGEESGQGVRFDRAGRHGVRGSCAEPRLSNMESDRNPSD